MKYKAIFKKLGKPLNEGDKLIRISANPKSSYEYDVFVGDFERRRDCVYLYLHRETMYELATASDIHTVREILSATQQHGFEKDIKDRGVSLDALAWAFAKAVIVEQEDARDNLMFQARELERQPWIRTHDMGEQK